MKKIQIGLIAAATLVGCAPYEHGHYIDDVAYGNSAGDPQGTPILFKGDGHSHEAESQTASNQAGLAPYQINEAATYSTPYLGAVQTSPQITTSYVSPNTVSYGTQNTAVFGQPVIQQQALTAVQQVAPVSTPIPGYPAPIAQLEAPAINTQAPNLIQPTYSTNAPKMDEVIEVVSATAPTIVTRPLRPLMPSYSGVNTQQPYIDQVVRMPLNNQPYTTDVVSNAPLHSVVPVMKPRSQPPLQVDNAYLEVGQNTNLASVVRQQPVYPLPPAYQLPQLPVLSAQTTAYGPPAALPAVQGYGGHQQPGYQFASFTRPLEPIHRNAPALSTLSQPVNVVQNYPAANPYQNAPVYGPMPAMTASAPTFTSVPQAYPQQVVQTYAQPQPYGQQLPYTQAQLPPQPQPVVQPYVQATTNTAAPLAPAQDFAPSEPLSNVAQQFPAANYQNGVGFTAPITYPAVQNYEFGPNQGVAPYAQLPLVPAATTTGSATNAIEVSSYEAPAVPAIEPAKAVDIVMANIAGQAPQAINTMQTQPLQASVTDLNVSTRQMAAPLQVDGGTFHIRIPAVTLNVPLPGYGAPQQMRFPPVNAPYGPVPMAQRMMPNAMNPAAYYPAQQQPKVTVF